uniref:Amidohydrolase-related domain-containing protein n=1 Tax=Chromera velia CCMP2878 TaxID=1169474 RepID=A0A0G4HYL4_9ALVE|mmetsp:Transcript_5833/g.11581  ORF Transcript_5833/g.11581 Transcript_5833/m.11581 type:complete len:460 (-) Transcript_5833:137-1516(-)|eukprot:Cvel_9523.t1-p1 / transcript=Cvel_9523.t1 / gene=Cvel_9523 / organism=Chromera_velia_CCMP2878 / gene_product=Uncharacterized protein YJL213W, putative / transcript_product=Uncharacterized protein YJL213W, putative / location=Cvel_scaffold551:46470-49136(-) / protein_length=459 / sequence_SO=supercontig / SO=protein_coding / is_pseudo=false
MSGPQILIKRVKIFDGHREGAGGLKNVLIEKNLIKKIVPSGSGEIDGLSANALHVDGDGKRLTPGLIDMHQHLMLGGPSGLYSTANDIDFATCGAIAAQHMYAHKLMKGVTTVRDIAGNSLGLAKAVKMGWVTGPRIYSSGPPIAPTGGHFDIGGWNQNRGQNESVLMGQAAICDGPLEVMKQCRWNFRKGAAFIKVMPGGGVATEYDPLEVVNHTAEELKAAVAIAEDNKTYVAAHAYRDDAVNRALDAGVRCVEHGFLMSEETVKRLARENIIFSLQGYMAGVAFAHPEKVPWYTAEQIRKAKDVHTGTMQVVEWVKKHKVFTVSGSDMFAEQWPILKKNITIEVSLFGFSPEEALEHCTGNASEVLAMSGPARNPYREGPLGVIREGAYADVLLWGKDPLQDISVLENEEELKLIVKDGDIFKNTTVPPDHKLYRPAPSMRISAPPPRLDKGGCCC